jgi:hypothetical protein
MDAGSLVVKKGIEDQSYFLVGIGGNSNARVSLSV